MAKTLKFDPSERLAEIMPIASDNEAVGAWIKLVMYLSIHGPQPAEKMAAIGGIGWDRAQVVFQQRDGLYWLDWMDEKSALPAAVKWPFDPWWKLYMKGSRKLSAAEWNKLNDADREACMNATPAYIESKPEKIYRKDGERFLKHRTWEDPIVTLTANDPTAQAEQRQADLRAALSRRAGEQGGANPFASPDRSEPWRP